MNTSTRTAFGVAALAVLISFSAPAEFETGNRVSTACASGKATGPARGYLPPRCYRPNPNFNTDRSYGPGKGYGRARGYIPGQDLGDRFNLGRGFGPCKGFKLG